MCWIKTRHTASIVPLLQEAYIAELDAKSGASLKLTVLNPNGRIWTMVAGGGASVIYRYITCPLPGCQPSLILCGMGRGMRRGWVG